MTNIGFFYRDALGGIEEDLPQSVEWFRKGAAGGDPNGMDALGYAYEHGLGVEQDLVESARWYMMAAAKGYSSGIADLAYAYDYGKGLDQDSRRPSSSTRRPTTPAPAGPASTSQKCISKASASTRTSTAPNH